MKPITINPICPVCRAENKPIPAGMGDQLFKCLGCGEKLYYKWRINKICKAAGLERATSSGSVFY